MLPLLVRIDNLKTGTSTQYAFARSPVKLGRSPMNDIVLDAGFISQWHGVVRFDEHTTEYFDLGSTNGTLANGQRVPKNTGVAVAGNVELRVVDLRFYCWRGPAPPHLLPDQSSIDSYGPATKTMMGVEKRRSLLDDGGKATEPRLMAAIQRLRPAYDMYRQSWVQMHGQIQQLLAVLPPEMQATAMAALQKEYPAMNGEEDLRRLAQERGVAPPASGNLSAGAAQVVGEFARALLPNVALETLQDVEKFLVRAATMIETSARAFVELRKGHAQFGNEMAVRTVNSMSPLTQAQDSTQVLAYLLDIKADATSRIQELTSAYADIMIHQVALLSGMMEGVRGLLIRLGPEAIDKEIAEERKGFLSFLWPFRAGARWRRFVQRHLEYSQEERQLSAAVFGSEFARGYSAVVGEDLHEKSAKLVRGKG